MTLRTILLTICSSFGFACVAPNSETEEPSQQHGESLGLRTNSEDDCVVVPRPPATAYNSTMIVEAIDEDPARRVFLLKGNREIWIGDGTSNEFRLSLGQKYHLTLTPVSSDVLVQVQEVGTSRLPWITTLIQKPHGLSEWPPVAVRPSGRKIDHVDFYWSAYRSTLRFRHP